MEERTSARTVEEDALEVFKESYMEWGKMGTSIDVLLSSLTEQI
jgi:hypothetical protein